MPLENLTELRRNSGNQGTLVGVISWELQPDSKHPPRTSVDSATILYYRSNSMSHNGKKREVVRKGAGPAKHMGYDRHSGTHVEPVCVT